ncbi:Helix-turn-helix domain-containing protein [Tenacibaculum sp. MAR_2009_124]|uniref:helix-turn-helix domain-containing protein n=1 Tax=Tenacibaculum sp. MAR_2009_124 TaxID=1250059 RepID=UPI00089431E7|nr:helix-turn-helix domain-containing protein [Tenacibaculum sp. MAR_2009_124]SED09532.1 Helix-turn-helix domain-containing protein [Tenacibaculum sp. MAR_2009_124]
MKTVVDFNRPVSRKENNPESQDNLDKNKKRFSKQCQKVYDALLRGKRLTTVSALLKYQIGDLRRRIKDLKDTHKINIKDKWVKTDGSRYKEYYM